MPATSAMSIITGGTDHFATVRHLRVQGSQRAVGRAMAAAAQAAHGELAMPQPAADSALERTRRQWFERNYPALHQRLLGVADHYGIDPGDTTVSLDWLNTYPLPAGCSVAFYPGDGTKDGHSVLSRNFDFPTATLSQIIGAPGREGERPLGADPWVVELRPDRGHASIVVGIMDVMGGMDGINDAGLTVALLADNETPEPEPTAAPQVGLSEQQVVRYLLDTCTTVDEAKHALRMAKHYYFFTPCHFVVADRTGASFVWEHSPRRNRELVIDGGPRQRGGIVCTNHLLHRWPDPTLLPDDEGPIGTAARTYWRWRTLDAAVETAALVDRDEIREHFGRVRFTAPVEGARTLWHALYDTDDRSAEVSFYRTDRNGESDYTAPVRFELGAQPEG